VYRRLKCTVSGTRFQPTSCVTTFRFDKFTSTVAACSYDQLGAEKPSTSCAAFLKSSEKAQQQWELEQRFHAFESAL